MTTSKRVNSTLFVENGTLYDCFLREGTSIFKPILLLTVDVPEDFLKNNYFRIPAFNRSYYVTDAVMETSRNIRVTGEIDLLGTYRSQVLSSKAYIMYSQSSYDSMLSDERIKADLESTQYWDYNVMSDIDLAGTYILTIASDDPSGKFGSVQAYAMDQNQMKRLANKLNDTSILAQLKEFWTGNLLDSIVSCIWIPVKSNWVANPNIVSIDVMGVSLSQGYRITNEKYSTSIEITPHVPYKYTSYDEETGAILDESWRDFRNCEPYTEYYLWLPGYGLCQIHMGDIIADGQDEPKFQLNYTVSTMTGEIMYTVCRENVNNPSYNQVGSVVQTIHGNFGVNIPISNRQGGFMDAAAKALSAGVMLATGHEVSGAVALIDAMKTSVSHASSTQGTLSGWVTSDAQLAGVYSITRVFNTTDSPSNLASTVGRPSFRSATLSSLKGITRCTGCYPRLEGATKYEQEQLSQLINSSTNFIYGGIIIE